MRPQLAMIVPGWSAAIGRLPQPSSVPGLNARSSGRAWPHSPREVTLSVCDLWGAGNWLRRLHEIAGRCSGTRGDNQYRGTVSEGVTRVELRRLDTDGANDLGAVHEDDDILITGQPGHVDRLSYLRLHVVPGDGATDVPVGASP